VIHEVNGQPIRTTADLDRALKAAAGAWKIGVERNGQRDELNVKL
jgi:S1-C subfamily serine protease